MADSLQRPIEYPGSRVGYVKPAPSPELDLEFDNGEAEIEEAIYGAKLLESDPDIILASSVGNTATSSCVYPA